MFLSFLSFALLGAWSGTIWLSWFCAAFLLLVPGIGGKFLFFIFIVMFSIVVSDSCSAGNGSDVWCAAGMGSDVRRSVSAEMVFFKDLLLFTGPFFFTFPLLENSV